MCGRFTLRTPLNRLVEQFLFAIHATDLPLRFNIAPTQPVAAVRLLDPDQERQLASLRWGLIPSWAKERSIANELINARSETVAAKPSFRSAFRHRRCLILSDGYYEWKKLGASGTKQPYYIRMRDERPFAFAGLWETWQDQAGTPLETCTVITTTANELTRAIHPRMPVILAAEDYTSWLDPRTSDRDLLTRLLRPYDSAAMDVYPVSSLVNNARHDSPECVVPVRIPSADDRRQSQLGFP
jgi:putative SOS response-associated peptidase YedK